MEVSEYGSGGHAWVMMGVLMSMRRFIEEGGEGEEGMVEVNVSFGLGVYT
jgi:hypothetical protein